MTWAETVDPQDHYLHKTNGDPWWNESTFMSLRVPGRNLMLMMYHYLRPNQNTAVGGPWVLDETGSDMATALHYAWDWHMPIPEGTEMFDCELPNGYKVETIEPQKEVRYAYQGPGCEIDFVYTAARKPHYTKARGGEINPAVTDFVLPIPGDVTTGHYEQYGYANGQVVIHGERVAIEDSVVILDRSWGPRVVLSKMERRRVAYASAMASPDHAFHIFAVNSNPADEDQVEGTVDPIMAGYYVKDGVLGDVVSGTRRCIERSPFDGQPLSEELQVEDSLGRTFTAVGRNFTPIRWPGIYGDFMSWVCQSEWTFDGIDAVPGEVQEWMMFRVYREFMLRTRGADSPLVRPLTA
jgi:hypothetical protein